MRSDSKVCELCGHGGRLTFHHLIPKTTHRRRRVRLAFDKDELNTRGAMLCSRCHKMVHKSESNIALALEFNTLERLRAHPELARYIAWAKKHPTPRQRAVAHTTSETPRR